MESPFFESLIYVSLHRWCQTPLLGKIPKISSHYRPSSPRTRYFSTEYIFNPLRRTWTTKLLRKPTQTFPALLRILPVQQEFYSRKWLQSHMQSPFSLISFSLSQLLCTVYELPLWNDCYRRITIVSEVNNSYNNDKNNGTANSLQNTDFGKYRVIHKSLRNFRTRLRNNQDRHCTVDISSNCKVGQIHGMSLALLTCSPSAWPSRLLYHRSRKPRRDLWISLYSFV